MKDHAEGSSFEMFGEHTKTAVVPAGEMIQGKDCYDIASPEPPLLQNERTWTQHISNLWIDDFQIRWDASKRLAAFGEVILPDLLSLVVHPDADNEMLWFLARLLGKFKHPDVAMALAHLLERNFSEDAAEEDANNDVIEAAATALANFGTDALLPLQQLLSVPEKRQVAVRAIAYIRSSDTIPTLISVATDRNPVVREAAIEALCSLPCRRDSLEVLLNAITDVSGSVRVMALKGIAVWANSHPERDWVGIVRPLLLDLNTTVAAAAVRVLGRVGTQAAVDELSLLLRDALAPQELKLEAVRALTWIETPEAIAALQQVLKSARANDADATLECIRGLGRYEPSALMATASKALQDWMVSLDLSQQSVEALRAIAHSLGRLGQPDSIPPLISLLHVEDNGVRFHAIAALKQFNRAIVTHLLQQSASLASECDREGIDLALSEMS
ncbi:MAG: HEAT repeat domain-containing protein [Cyanobacteria bacterium P01_E01_bin.34]